MRWPNNCAVQCAAAILVCSSATVFAAPAGAAQSPRPMVPTTCAARLTFTLQPGLEYRPAGQPAISVRPSPVLAGQSTIIRLPVEPHARRTSTPLIRPPLLYSPSPYLETALAEYRVMIGIKRSTSWYIAALASCGYTITSRATSGQTGDGVTTDGYWFTLQSDPHQSLSLAFQRDGATKTLVLYLAEFEAAPARPANSYIPSDVTRANVSYLMEHGPGGSPYHTYRAVKDPRSIKKLVVAVNSLTQSGSLMVFCAYGPGHGKIVFVTRDRRRYVVWVQADCGGIVVGLAPTQTSLPDQGQLVWKAVLHVVPPS